MKMFLAFILALMLVPFPAFSASAGAAESKLTLMIYMCGSNLESGYGSASRDIGEMLDAGISRDVNVLVMIGGSESWSRGYDPDQCVILGVTPRGIVQRGAWDRMNMGAGETLTQLLAFGMEHYPAEEYALILWDHGGGPNEGVCWDELFGMDRLSLQELTGGIKAARMEKKLKWIGFDACLMSSLEVASALSPYAEYMIASQETEPDFGWNYAFLNGIENDTTGADIGRRIVDAYFEGREDYTDVLTLACTDLSKTAEIGSAMDAFFSDPSLSVTPETFTLLSAARGGATGFGKAAKAAGEDGYDLVDARGLLDSLSAGNPEAGQLSRLMDSLIVYSRSNEDGANGISMYHPYANKRKYLDAWRESYDALGFSAGYTNYINAFGDVLLGGEMTDWSSAETTDAGFGAGFENLFTLQLTEEQQAGFASAQLLILTDLLNDHQLENYCSVVYAGRAETDGSGLVTAFYSGRSLYIEDEHGTLFGPVDFKLTDDGQLAYIQAVYIPEGAFDSEAGEYVIFYLEPDGTEEYPEILRTRVLDRATGTFTNRIAFSEDPYRYLHLIESGRQMPETDERGLLPMFDAWPEEILLGGIQLELPVGWRFRWMENQLTGNQLYAVFEVTDAQQNRFCTPPVPVRNPNRAEYTGIPETEAQGFDVSAKAVAVRSDWEKGVRFLLSVGQQETDQTEYRIEQLTVNGERLLEHASTLSFTLGGSARSETAECFMNPLELFGIDRIETLSMTVSVKKGGAESIVPVSFRFDDCGVSDFCKDVSVLAEAEQDGVTMQLIDMQPYAECGFELDVIIRNSREKVFSPESEVTVNGYEMDGYSVDGVPAGVSSPRRFQIPDSISVTGITTSGAENEMVYLARNLLQRRGIREVEDITVYAHTARRPDYSEAFSFHLSEPLPIPNNKNLSGSANDDIMLGSITEATEDPDDSADNPAGSVPLAECNQYSVSLGKILLARNGAALLLEIENRTDAMLTVYGIDPQINGKDVKFLYGFDDQSFTVTPHSTRIAGMAIEGGTPAEAAEALNTISFGLQSTEQREREQTGPRCVITPADRHLMGTDIPVWIQADRILAEKVLLPDTEIPEPYIYKVPDRMLNTEVLMPDRARELTQTICPEMTDEQAEHAVAGVMFAVQVRKDGCVLTSFMKMKPDGDGRLRCRFPGMILCAESNPDAFIPFAQEWTDGDEMNLEISQIIPVNALDEDETVRQTAADMIIRVNMAENHADISSVTLEGEPRELTQVHLPQYVNLGPKSEEGRLLYFMDWDSSDLSSSRNRFVSLHGEPLRLALRPITAEDNIRLVFSLMDDDGKIYTLESMPVFP